jgi:hypothetical protein
MRALPVNTPNESSRAYGPCLYLGPGGERCGEPARENGFCGRHDPEGTQPAEKAPTRRIWAVLATLAVLWPVLVDVIREILKWLK